MGFFIYNGASVPPKVILHIGTHKTGSTSIQSFACDQKSYFSRNNFKFCKGLKGKPNFKELLSASISPHRSTRGVLRPHKLPRFILAWKVKRHIRQAALKSPGATMVVSSELLSFLREPEEISRLKKLFPRNTTFAVVVVLRPKYDFLESYKRQMIRQGLVQSFVQGDLNYVEPDSWLVDFEGLLKTFRHLTADIRVLDYAAECKICDNIVPSFCRAIGIPEAPETNVLPFITVRGKSARDSAPVDSPMRSRR